MPLVQMGAQLEPPRGEAHERARKIRPEFTRGQLVRVAGGRNQAEAELIQNLLLEEGVPSMLRRSAGFDVPDMLAAGPRDVMVPESGAGTARSLLHEAELIGPAAPASQDAMGNRALAIAAGILGGGAVTALIAWLLLGAAG